MRDVLNYLESFVLLTETLSFSETALLMNVTQPCVSRQIRLLEENLGVRLFVRDRHRVHLSEAGRDLKLRLSPLVKEIQTVLREKRDNVGRVEGTVAFGSLSEVGQSTFFPLLLAFRKTHPGVRLDVHYLKEFEIVEALKNGALAFGVLTAPPEAESIRCYEVFAERVLCVTRDSNAGAPFDPGTAEFVAYREGDKLLQAWFRGHEKGRGGQRKPHMAVTVNSHRSMVEALLATNAYAVMPERSVERELASGALRQASPHAFHNALYLAVQENALLESKNAALCRHLLDGCKTLKGTTHGSDGDTSRKRKPGKTGKTGRAKKP